jgi:hypothetical protein
MKEYLKCKACGYIIEKDDPAQVCPACGIQRKVFEEYKFTLSPRRKLVLDLDIHAILVHFPQTIGVLIPFFGILSLITEAGIGMKFLYTVEAITYILPPAVLASILSGLFDGNIRFKKLNTPALKKKIILASILLAVTSVMAYINYTTDIRESLLLLTGLSVISLAIQEVLARTGIKLMFAWLPG